KIGPAETHRHDSCLCRAFEDRIVDGNTWRFRKGSRVEAREIEIEPCLVERSRGSRMNLRRELSTLREECAGLQHEHPRIPEKISRIDEFDGLLAIRLFQETFHMAGFTQDRLPLLYVAESGF